MDLISIRITGFYILKYKFVRLRWVPASAYTNTLSVLKNFVQFFRRKKNDKTSKFS